MSGSTRRSFIGRVSQLAVAGSGALAVPLWVRDASAAERWFADAGVTLAGDTRAPSVVAEDEAYWAKVRTLYRLQDDVLNFDNGWTSPAPATSLAEIDRSSRRLEGLPAEHLPAMWADVSNVKLRAELASALGVPGEALALVRNATEALDTVLLGLPLSAGDEVVCSVHDYYAMLDALEQRRARDGIVLKVIQPPIPATSMDDLYRLYADAIGERTRLVLLTHPSNLTGQQLPVKRIVDAAHAAGAEVVVDGAQSAGLLVDPIKSLGCDYYGASCHKWLGTPVGLGVLWMKPDHTGKVWPLLPPMAGERGMGRFEWIGTAPEYINIASIPALALHREIGAARKQARLRFLGSVMREQLSRVLPDASFYATLNMALGLTTFEVPGIDSARLQKALRGKHNILVQAMVGIRSDPRIRGIRLSPNVYSTVAEAERVAGAIHREVSELRRG